MQYHKRLQHSSATHNLPLCPNAGVTALDLYYFHNVGRSTNGR